jgi:PAS domain S-box-containing protein
MSQKQKFAQTVTNSNGDFIRVNDRAEEIYGYSKDELLDMNFADLIADPKRCDEKSYAKALVGEKNSDSTKVKRADGTVGIVDYQTTPVEIDGETCLRATFDSIDMIENEESASKTVNSNSFEDISKEQLERITSNIRVDAPDGEMELNKIVLDLLVGHNEIEQYKKGALSLHKAVDERLQEEEKRNPDSDEVEVLRHVKRSAFGLYLRIHRGDKELHGNRDGEYSGYFN